MTTDINLSGSDTPKQPQPEQAFDPLKAFKNTTRSRERLRAAVNLARKKIEHAKRTEDFLFSMLQNNQTLLADAKTYGIDDEAIADILMEDHKECGLTINRRELLGTIKRLTPAADGLPRKRRGRPPKSTAAVPLNTGANPDTTADATENFAAAVTQTVIATAMRLLHEMGYLPGDRSTAPFIALIGLVWARLPLLEDLKEEEKRILTVENLNEHMQRVDKALDRYFQSDILPQIKKMDSDIGIIDRQITEIKSAINSVNWDSRLEKLDTDIGNILKRTNQIKTGPVNEDWDEKLEKLETEVAEKIAGQIIAEGKQQFQGVYLLIVGLATTLAFVLGWVVPVAIGHVLGR
jgi:hypothetical protein